MELGGQEYHRETRILARKMESLESLMSDFFFFFLLLVDAPWKGWIYLRTTPSACKP